MVVRPTNGPDPLEVELVGVAIVDGVMEGQYWSHRSFDEKTLEEFHIC
jgi:hypothetical protein